MTPTYKERENLGMIMDRVRVSVPDVLVLDDNSPDGTSVDRALGTSKMSMAIVVEALWQITRSGIMTQWHRLLSRPRGRDGNG